MPLNPGLRCPISSITGQGAGPEPVKEGHRYFLSAQRQLWSSRCIWHLVQIHSGWQSGDFSSNTNEAWFTTLICRPRFYTVNTTAWVPPFLPWASFTSLSKKNTQLFPVPWLTSAFYTSPALSLSRWWHMPGLLQSHCPAARGAAVASWKQGREEKKGTDSTGNTR